MRAANIRGPAAVRPAHSTETGRHLGHHAGGLQQAVSGDRWGALRPKLAWMDGVFPEAGCSHQNPGPLSGWGQHPSGAWRADGGAVGPIGGREPAGGPDFGRSVPTNGYAWWYVDALSDDGQDAITIIAFVGSVFSPYYASARRKGPTDPNDHCAVNIAIYRKHGSRWAMTERPRAAVSRTSSSLAIGKSNLNWDGNSLLIRLDEISVPVPGRLRGTVRIVPTAVTRRSFMLSEPGNHRWWPIAPCARVQVLLDSPHLRWQGDGYFDMNWGDAPLEDGFTDWQWSRGTTRDGTAIIYEATRIDGDPINLAMNFDPQGQMTTFAPPPALSLPRTGWRIDRSVPSEGAASVTRTLENAPFYARSVVAASWLGEPVTLIHESLALTRFRKPLVQAMLPFRMPRAWR
jgi:carotenoid 1,2-hydratase